MFNITDGIIIIRVIITEFHAAQATACIIIDSYEHDIIVICVVFASKLFFIIIVVLNPHSCIVSCIFKINRDRTVIIVSTAIVQNQIITAYIRSFIDHDACLIRQTVAVQQIIIVADIKVLYVIYQICLDDIRTRGVDKGNRQLTAAAILLLVTDFNTAALDRNRSRTSNHHT